MQRISALLLLALLPACAHLRGTDVQARQRADLWTDAHLAFHAEDFRQARTTFRRLADDFPRTDEGREALFYLGAVSLDPRNAEWNPEQATQLLRDYLALDTSRAVIHRRPEATTLLRLADQLVLSAAEPRVAPGAGSAPPPEAPRGSPRAITTAAERQMLAELDSLRRQLVERDETIRRQREELERIRRVLAPRQ
ncbi:hypothetical protein BH24GEM3_BH24GEM3_12320 [soil metagenome]